MPPAYVEQMFQLVRRPDPAYRIMRRAENKGPDIVINDPAFKIFKVDIVSAIIIDEF